MGNSTENSKEETIMNNSTNGKEETTMSNNTNSEEETIMNNTAENSTEAKDIETPCSLVEMIPPDERAVVDTNSTKESKVVVIRTIEPLMDMASEIPEEEREAVESLPANLAEIASCGCFTPAVGMKGFVTNTGHIIFAKRCIKSKTDKVIIYCQQYSNGNFSDVMEVNMADLFLASTYHFTTQTTSGDNNATMKRKVSSFLLEVSQNYYNSLEYPRENIKVISLLNLLIRECENMPIEYRVSILEQPEKLYWRMVQIIKNKSLNIVDEHDSYYTLWKDQIHTIAEELQVKPTKLLKKLKEYQFLYLTESSEGYQTCVRIKPDNEFQTSPTEWCYCILKLEYLAKIRQQRTNK